ncbi:hypothetical protein, partial [Nocardia abscessus]|uniref:hypothetical protein n=1 Tax=Nocardia abscessus TaxID=120957 RepID=UPI0024588006
MFVGIAALGLSIYGVVRARRGTGGGAAPSTGGTSITGSVIGGGVSPRAPHWGAAHLPGPVRCGSAVGVRPEVVRRA